MSADHIAVGRDRCQGYFDALEAHRIEVDEGLVFCCDDFMEETGYRAALKLLSSSNRPTAIFSPGDIAAIGVYRAIEELGLRIPEDVAVVGYDDIPPAARLSPPMTSVRTSYGDFGVESAQLLVDIIRFKRRSPCQVVIEQSLVVRASSGSKL